MLYSVIKGHMKRNVLEVPINYVWYCQLVFFVMVHVCIKLHFVRKKILAENRDINSKVKNRESYLSLNRAGLACSHGTIR